MDGDKRVEPSKPAPGLPGTDESVRLLRALGHPVRFQIVRVVTDPGRFAGPGDVCGDCEVVCACRLRMLLHVSAPDLTHHVAVLKKAGLLEARRRGKMVHYLPRREAVARLLPAIGELSQEDLGSSCSRVARSVGSTPGRMA